MIGRPWTRLTLKALHDVASLGIGGGLAACLVLNLMAPPLGTAEYAGTRQAIALIARYVLLPSMGVVLVSGLLAIAATRGYHNAAWAWVKAFLGLAVLQATLITVGAAREQAELAVAVAADPAVMSSLMQSERKTLWLLIAISVVNIVLAVWRPKLVVTVR